MLANGSDWSSLSRTTFHGCGPSGRRGCSFIGLLRALADSDSPTGEFQSLLSELDVGDLLDRRLLRLFDVAVADAVVDRPLRALGIEAGVDRPHAVLGVALPGVLDRVLRLLGGVDHDRHHLVL